MTGFCKALCCCIQKKSNREHYSTTDLNEGLIDQANSVQQSSSDMDGTTGYNPFMSAKNSRGNKKDKNSDDEVSHSSMSSSVGVSSLFVPLM
mmetsp:Transcript_13118/g.24132  ORF Transcript_13118/g.24132 Transcript_13118/m.24132 type:complete len:92 (+) Transcript_13118:125-400(+)|eukprot:CAMPEP_0201865802 /NCGR_PEP_ID=MMETSP0902-20130614/594_1 /ASSEMBLY_ACC=CAM_ASM_000551 /TAXON_ID=420261 /ORGANISM="Thalassiosira antarctica, Strain CCMP982" /LENGTH=91 /DNA_ID=CAMNT_0048390649 /DNA_START=130 /DNA_END=405 /DNA_ORIENTATION=+